jgi:hypothetical protein
MSDEFEYRRNPNPPKTTDRSPVDPTRQWVRDGLTNFPTTLNDGDILAVRDKIFATYGRRCDRPSDVLKSAEELLTQTINHIPGTPMVGVFTSVLGALERAQEEMAEYDTHGLGAQKAILELAVKRGFDLGDEQALMVVITNLGQPKNGQQQGFLPQSASARQQQNKFENEAREHFEKDRLIKSITRGKPGFPLPRTLQKKYLNEDHGKAINRDSASLARLGLEDLREIDQAVADYRNTRDGMRVAPADQVEGITATVQNKTGYMGSNAQDEFLAHPSDPTREFTPKEVKQNIRELLFQNGQSRGPARVAAINRILRGESYNGPRPGGN